MLRKTSGGAIPSSSNEESAREGRGEVTEVNPVTLALASSSLSVMYESESSGFFLRRATTPTVVSSVSGVKRSEVMSEAKSEATELESRNDVI